VQVRVKSLVDVDLGTRPRHGAVKWVYNDCRTRVGLDGSTKLILTDQTTVAATARYYDFDGNGFGYTRDRARRTAGCREYVHR